MESVIETGLANVSVVDLTKEELLEEYNSLKKRHDEVLYDTECKNQQIYDYKRQVATLTALEREYQQEIEALQSQDANQTKKVSETIQNLEEEVKSLKEHVSKLEDECLSKSDEIEKLENDLKSVVKTPMVVDDSKEVEKLRDENHKLKNEMIEITNHIEESEVAFEELRRTNLELEENLKNIREEYSQLKEFYEAKQEEISEKNTLLENLQDELFVVKSELEQLKSQPQDQGTRGNSLFAEVDDRRVQLMKKMKFMQTKFQEMKGERAKMLREVDCLRKENAILQEKYKNDVVEKATDIENIESAYKNRVKVLEDLLESYKCDLKDHTITLTGSNLVENELRYIEGIFKQKSSDVEKMREDLNKYSLTDVLNSFQLRDCRAELRRYKLQAMEYKQELDELKLSAVTKKTDELIEKTEEKQEKSRLLKPPNAAMLSKLYQSRQKQFNNSNSNPTTTTTINDKPIIKEEQQKEEIKTSPSSKNIIEEKEKKSKEDEKISSISVENKENVKQTNSPELEEEVNTNTNKNAKKGGNGSKKVQFSSDTASPEKPKAPIRRGGMILTCKTLYVPSAARKK